MNTIDFAVNIQPNVYFMKDIADPNNILEYKMVDLLVNFNEINNDSIDFKQKIRDGPFEYPDTRTRTNVFNPENILVFNKNKKLTIINQNLEKRILLQIRLWRSQDAFPSIL